jgi:tRNA A-37 threonylcarbamoyl transferase component Bud32/dienelactone hydrolase
MDQPSGEASVISDRERLTAALSQQYRIERELGRGGNATVYLAEDLKHRRKVAIKVLRPELATALGPERFLREIDLVAKLTHPHILTLHDSGTAAGFLFYVMPYVEGESLRDRLDREGQLPLEEALRITRDVAAALSHAHSYGVVHRDIKPENILLSAGEAVVADFGVARAMDAAGSEQLTKTGLSVGTPAYMSPEQASGEREVDPRTDLYGLGCVVYEMLAGDPPFTASTAQALMARKFVEPPPSLRAVRDTVSPMLEQAVLKALARLPADRYATVGQFADALAQASVAPAAPGPAKLGLNRFWSGVRRNRWAALASVAVAMAVTAGAVRVWEQQSGARWARNVALPEVIRLVGEGQTYPAFRLLRQAEAYVPDDPVLKEALVESTKPLTVRTTPPGAHVYARDFFDEPDAWELLGSTPLEGLRLPVGMLVFKISLEGYQTKEELRFNAAHTLQFSLQPEADAPHDMVHVPGGSHELFDTKADLDDFWIDRYEITNRQFNAFLDQGGYERREFWTEPVLEDGVTLAWEESRPLFHDRTGRPGPAVWEVGTYPDGQDDYPVGGVSWYEAAAYCASVGKQLPTIHHWYHAAALGAVTGFAMLGNFAAEGPATVGHPFRLGFHGTYDMAGNVKEWVWNEGAPARRYILGGGWNEPSYQFRDYDAQAPSAREPAFGIRCALYRAPLPDAQTARVGSPFRDYRRESPVGDEIFGVYRSLYEYDRTTLEPQVDPVRDEFENWTVERVSFAAAYGNERVPALLYLPKTASPPYQTVVYFPGANAFWQGTSFEDVGWEAHQFLFAVRSGRAVLFPSYNGTFERHVGSTTQPHIWRDVMIHAAKDLRRAVDYLETRSDIDAQRLGYFGLSLGAGVGPIMTAVEPRFRASVLLGGGLYFWQRPPESEAFHFASRVEVPTLMINGRHDFFFPWETSQVPMFDLLGTPDKRHAVFESGHVPTERQEVMRETLDWLDRYLGPVRRAPGSSDEP